MSEFQPVRLQHEGVDLVGQIIAPSGGGKGPAVLLMPSAMGVGPSPLGFARKLAAEGYVVLVADMYGGGAYFTEVAEVSKVLQPLVKNTGLLRSRVVAWYETLKTQAGVDADRIGAIGYCFGGRCVLELARSGADVKVVVSFHGTLTTTLPAGKGDIKGRVAIYAAAHDPHAPQADIDAFIAEMRASEALWYFTYFSDAYHAFTSREDAMLPLPGLRYDELADNVSWAGMLAMMKTLL